MVVGDERRAGGDAVGDRGGDDDGTGRGRQRHRSALADTEALGVVVVDLDEGIAFLGGLQLVGADAQPAFVDEQRVGEQRERVVRPALRGGGTGPRPVARALGVRREPECPDVVPRCQHAPELLA